MTADFSPRLKSVDELPTFFAALSGVRVAVR